MSTTDVTKKKKKSVKFAEDDCAKQEKSAKTQSKPGNIKKVEVSVDLGGKDQVKGKKRKHKVKKNQAEKRQKLMESLVGPKVEEIDFESEDKTFADFGLDERILKCIGELGWKKPTSVQESVIQLVLENKNVMGRGRTGSGKTGAFLIPLVQKLILQTLDPVVGPSSVVIGPTKELCTQIFKQFVSLSKCLPFLQAMNLCDVGEEETSVWLEDRSHVVLTSPGKLLKMIKLRPDYCSQVNYLVLDEADLLLSYGYEQEMIEIRSKLPQIYQCVMTSATLKEDMTTLKKVLMTGPVVTVKLTESDEIGDQLTQYQLTCESDEHRFAILVAMFKLKLLVGRCILFVNSIDRCYKLHLILRVFGVKTAILNSAMPANSRCHVINQFNEGSHQILIASDVTDADGTKLKEQLGSAENGEAEKEKGTKKKRAKVDKESGVSRGIDFHHVANVVNFDFPTTTDAYIHRVGRTARGFNKGTALSFCTPIERPFLDKIQEEINEQLGRKMLQPYEFRIKELDTFLLRTREALSKCTKGAVKAARIKEIRQEVMRSANLQSFFAKNEREKMIMQTDCHPVMLKLNSPAISDVTSYMVPQALRGADFSMPSGASRKRYNMGQRHRQKLKHKFQKKGKDPLMTFKI